jgi:hypothetical protein
MTASKFNLTRRQILAGAAALPLFSIASRPAYAAEFNYKFATGQDPSHPVNKRAQEAIDRIRNATGGRLGHQALPGQPARFGHRSAVAGSKWRRRVLQPGERRVVDPGAGGRHHQHRLRVP